VRHLVRLRLWVVSRQSVLILLSAFGPAVLRAQVGSTTDLLTGVVRGPDGKPLQGAGVEATSVETEITRRTVTNATGRYAIVFPDGGGQYRVAVRYVGMAPQLFAVTRQGDEDRLVRDVRLSTTVLQLEPVMG
jgi:carboxypeptidase family protein